MEAAVVSSAELGLLLLPFLTVLLLALCLRCRELPASYDSASPDSLYPSNLQIKRPYTIAHWPPDPIHTTPYPLTQPDVPPIPSSPRPPVSSHQTLASRQDSESAISVASYENEGVSGTPEPACEDMDEDEEDDEEDYPNSEGYLEVLPDSTPTTAAAPRNLRESACSMEDYVNVPESEESAEASLDGSREYVNVSQELHPQVETTEPAPLSSQEMEEEEEEEEEEPPDYENLQDLN